MLCRQCGMENRDGAQFCAACGGPLGTAPARRGVAPGVVIGLIVALVFLTVCVCVGGGILVSRLYLSSQPARETASPPLPALAQPPAAASEQGPAATADPAPPSPESREASVKPAKEPSKGRAVIPHSSERALTDADLTDLGTRDLCIARNEIFARHGLVFQSPPLREYFEAQPWYKGTASGQAAVESKLSAVERGNIAKIKALESKRGSKYLKGTFDRW